MQKIVNEVRPTQTNGVQRVKRFVNLHVHCIVSNLERISKVSTLLRVEKCLLAPMDALISIEFLGHKACCCWVQFF